MDDAAGTRGAFLLFYASMLRAFMCMHEVRRRPVCRARLTALLHGLIGPVLAVFHIVAHLAAVDTLAVLTAELFRPVALCDCWRHTTERAQKLTGCIWDVITIY